MNRENQVKDYLFSNTQDVLMAQEELEKIEKLEPKISQADIELLYKLYNKSIEKRTFQTPVGLEFMLKVKKILDNNPNTPGEVVPIPLYTTFDLTTKREQEAIQKRQQFMVKKKNDDAKKLKTSIIVNVVLALMVIAMFFIATTGKNPNILNYENAIINKYAEWEQELRERENRIVYYENEYGIERQPMASEEP
ncbi:MAG: hypothetical protein IJD31_04635 [Lachnospiraceae bacterium]|nr:hypothetical protein [Lachnospiraceae bacterium]